jgi:hypothetical protein
MLRWLTAGESHGPALVAILEGLPAHVSITTDDISEALARRRLGRGRGARMKFEQDRVTILGGVRHGETQGGPVAIEIANSEWPKWEQVMAADPVDQAELDELARNAPLTRPRPGHADLVGMQKYDFEEARPVLERASARVTAARVALGRVAAAFLEQATGARLVSHVVELGLVDRVGGHHPLPLGPLTVRDLDRDRAALGLAVPHPTEDGHPVLLELHPGPAPASEPATGQRLGDVVGRDRDVRGQPLQDRDQGGAVGLPRGEPAQHGRQSPMSPRAGLTPWSRRDGSRPGPPRRCRPGRRPA